METKSTFQFMRFNVHGYGTTISTSAGAESSVYTLDFTPKTAKVYVIWTLTCTYPLNNGVVQAWGDIASGPANSRQSSSQHSHPASTRASLPSTPFVVTGLTPGQLYTARIRWNGAAGTLRSMTVGDNEQAYIAIFDLP